MLKLVFYFLKTIRAEQYKYGVRLRINFFKSLTTSKIAL
jgi:hypothetical protein